MRALILALLLAGCAAKPTPKPEPPPPKPVEPLSVVAFFFCDALQGVILTLSDGDTLPFSAADLVANPPLAQALDKLPQTSVHLKSPEICGCAT